MNYANRIALATLLFFILFSCQTGNNQSVNDKINIVCTTGMIADMLENIAGDKANILAIMGPGVDPHLYKASFGDLTLLRNADLIFYNGLHLEGKMQEIFEQLAKTKPVYAISDGLNEVDLITVDNNSKTHDPHIWFDVSLWNKTSQLVLNKLVEIDSVNAELYSKNKLNYNNELNELHSWVAENILTIAEPKRVLITSHDAFSYFGKAYQIKVKGLQGISTSTEFGLKDVGEMINLIVENNIKAVFVESTISERSLNAVVEGCNAKNHPIKIGGTLYSDAMGNKGTPQGTYVGMVKHNVNTIVKALK